MKKIQIDRSSWHYRFIKRLVAVDDEDLSNTCLYFWYFVRAVLSVGFFILMGVVFGLIACYTIFGSIYAVYLLIMGYALTEFAKGALLVFGTFSFVIIIALLSYFVPKLFKKAAKSADNLAESGSSAGQVYKSVKNKTCAYIEFK